MLWELAGNTLGVTTLAAPLVIQTMHPMIGAAVTEHSVALTDPWGRLVRSLDSIMLWVYGGPAALEEGQRLRELHKPIRGIDDHGRRYAALNAEAYAWVHGTAFAWIVATWPLTCGRDLTAEEQQQLYGEILQLGEILQVPRSQMPADAEAYWVYYEEMVRDRLENHPYAQAILNSLIKSVPPPPFLPRALRPLWWPAGKLGGHATWLATVGSMPPEIRALLEQRWTRADELQLRGLFAVLRPIHQRLPERLRYLPLARHARAHARSLEDIHRRARESFV
jgi:uncharacterized protein (DUF2236 family)